MLKNWHRGFGKSRIANAAKISHGTLEERLEVDNVLSPQETG